METTKKPVEGEARAGSDFIRARVSADVASGKHGSRVVTRFPPEPNGYLHIGHAKSICLNFGVAAEFAGRCHLRFDDTNPETEDIRYVESITNDVRWLGFEFQPHLYFASDYFPQMYEFAEHLIQSGQAYVDSSSEEEIREARGTVTEPGRPTLYRDRTVEENLDLFRRMKAGEFPDGAHVLRAKIDLSATNMLMRDPILYRIRHAHHYRTGDNWCIYPLYDYAHPIEDALECVTHSLCTLEFENNRELYDWVIEHIPFECRPEQIEFARLALDYTVMSKRKLLQLVNSGLVSGWDDPRMPTIAGMRRRGVTPEALRLFSDMIGVSKANSRVDISKLEFAIREELNQRVPRVLCVPQPLRVVLTNYPEGQLEEFDAPYYPHDVPLEGSRFLPFTRELYIDRDDFSEDPPKGYFRLAPGREVRLRYAYIIRCESVVKNDQGEIVELHCTYDPATRGGSATDGRAVKGTIQWVSAEHSVPCQLRLYDRLFRVPDPDEGDDFREFLNPQSLVVLEGARIEAGVRRDPPGMHYQFERVGYFCSDAVDSSADALVFNRTVSLRDSWAKVAEPHKQSEGRPQRKVAAPTTSPSPQPKVDRPTELDLISRDLVTMQFFQAAVAAQPDHADAIAKYLVNEVPRELKGRTIDQLPIVPAALAELVALIETGIVSGTAGKEVLARLASEGGSPRAIVEREGLLQINDAGALLPIIDDVIAQNSDKATAYRGGRTGLLGFFVGQVMARTGGRANAELVRTELERKLNT